MWEGECGREREFRRESVRGRVWEGEQRTSPVSREGVSLCRHQSNPKGPDWEQSNPKGPD